MRLVFHYGYKYNGYEIYYLQETRNGENKKAKRLKFSTEVSPIVQNASQVSAAHDETFQSSRSEDRQHPAVASAKFEHTSRDERFKGAVANGSKRAWISA